MDRKIVTIVLSLALIASFFLPFNSGGPSAFDIVSSKLGDWQKYLLLIFPICGLLLLLGAINNGNYVISRGLLAWLPLLLVLYILFILPIINEIKFEYIIRHIGIGYGAGKWIAIITSLVLAFYSPRSK